jgi:hypothetical protein
MKTISYIFLASILAVLIIGAVGYADGPVGGTGGVAFAMMGGQGGMMGGQGGMMGGKEYGHGNPDLTEETAFLRKQIREKRAELATLYRSDNTDKTLIDKKIDELNQLERHLDEKMSTR